MNRLRRGFALVVVVVGAVTVGIAAADAPTDRLAGENRFDTAVAISQAQFPDGATIAHLARATDPLVDALAGGALTAGPILLVPSCGDVPTEVLDEITRLDPDLVVALGGESAVCSQVLLDAAQGRSTDRLAGESRFDTAVAISQAQFPDGATIAHLARATDPLVDALAGGALTAGPILLVPSCGDVPTEVLDEITRLDPDLVVALGGEGAVCSQVLLDAAQGRSTDRLAGESRFDTAVAISQAQFPDGATIAHLARATDPLVDALAGGALTGGPILLVPPCGDLPTVVADEIERLAPDRVVALGGPTAICDELLAAAGAAAPDPSTSPSDTSSPTETGTPTESGSPTETGTPEPPADPSRTELVALHDALDGSNWDESEGWDTAEPTCTWFGIDCSNDEVTELRLRENGLDGDVPTEFGALTSLTEVDLNGNALTSLPNSLGQLENLTKLGLSVNDLTAVPSSIGQLDQLENLGLRNNELTSLPDEVGDLTSLRNLNLLNNALVGDITGWVTGLWEADVVRELLLDDGPGGNDCLTVSGPDEAALRTWLDGHDDGWDTCVP